MLFRMPHWLPFARSGPCLIERPRLPLTTHRYAFGECYFEATKDVAEELLEQQKEKKEEEMQKLKEELAGIKDELADLKSKLYGRFGKNINLEE